MFRFVAHSYYPKGVVCLRFVQGIKKMDSPILLVTLNSELYCLIYTVDMIQKKLLMGLLLADPSVIHKPVPKLGGLEADLRASLSKCSMYRMVTMD